LPAKKNDAVICLSCDGQRYIRYDVEINHPMFGVAIPCPVCNKEEVASYSGLNAIERSVTFKMLKTNGLPGMTRLLSATQAFIADGCKGFLAVHGGYGNGKSTLLKAIVNNAIDHKIKAKYITMTEVMVYAREAFESEKAGDTDYGRISTLAKYPVLCIDECDKARITEYAREVQTHLFDVRYRQSHLMGTVVAWNGEFENLDLPWVRSRLSQFTVINNTDPDMRPLLGNKL
jgi:DNA replication protein DnaC